MASWATNFIATYITPSLSPSLRIRILAPKSLPPFFKINAILASI